MRVEELIELIEPEQITGTLTEAFTHVCTNSKECQEGSIFIAIKGTRHDGHQYIPQAVKRGAKVVICEELPEPLPDDRVLYLKVKSTRRAWALIERATHGNPDTRLVVTGVTGTNGKSTLVHLLHETFNTLGYKNIRIGTLGAQITSRKENISTNHTSPPPSVLYELLSKAVEAGCTHAFMEVSSHALDQERTAGISFRCAAFTTIGHDHLDYHGTFANYLSAKKKLFAGLSPDSVAVVNADNPYHKQMLENCKAQVVKCSLHGQGHINGRILEATIEGMHLLIDGIEFYTTITGTYNAMNLLLAYAIARSLLSKHSPQEILEALSGTELPPGRMERIQTPTATVVIDYAHTPDALKNLLQSIKKLATPQSRIITVVGCGGNRDRLKRPLMGRVAVRYSDIAIFTSDNPRYEDPQAIIKDMERELTPHERNKVITEVDRAQAIKIALSLAHKDDIVVIAGKGHEEYQEINGKKIPFSDRQTVISLLSGEKTRTS